MSNGGFATLVKRVKIRGFLETQTPLHIGAGRGLGVTGSDLPVVKDPFDRPFIPGSSMKGVLRSQIEAVIRGLNESGNRRLWTCDVVAGAYCVHPNDWDKGPEDILPRVCDVCRLFGAPYVASKVSISDLPVEEGTWDPHLFQVRDGIAIDRESLTVSGKKKFDLEVVPPGVRFRMEIVVENPDDHELGLLYWALDLFNQGSAWLGGNGTRGLGRIRVGVSEVQEVSPASLLTAPPPPGDPENSSQELPEPFKALVDLLRGRGGQDRVDRIIKDITSSGYSDKKLKEAYGIKDRERLLKLAEEKGLIRLEAGKAVLVAGEQPAAEVRKEEADRLQVELQKYLPALRRKVQG